MPHQCTNCGRQFADGSKEMLSGCPDCGGNKFQFRPKGTDAGGSTHPASGDQPRDDSEDSPATPDDSAATSDDPFSNPWPSHDDAGPDDGDDADIIEADPEPPANDGESSAQADARRDVVTPDEVAGGAPDDAEAPPVSEPDATVASTPDDDRPDLSELRNELNEQFESIRVLNPGQYELNLMELYDREEYIISLREDGRYVIEVPETWRDAGPE
ncbi:MAG: Zn-ribbon domain-containing protein [Haloferacaceae archaeon]